MNANIGLGFKWRRITIAAQASITTDRMGIGGGIVIDPQGDHPNIFANLMLVFLLITFTIHLCAHSLEHP